MKKPKEKLTAIQALRKYEGNSKKSVLASDQKLSIQIQDPPSLLGLKIADIFNHKAGGRVADDMTHEMTTGDLYDAGLDYMTNDNLKKTMLGLRKMSYVIYDEEKDEDTIGGYVDQVKIRYSKDDHKTIIRYRYSQTFRDLALTSNHYAVIDRQTVFALTSRYSVLLFQYLSPSFRLDHVHFKEHTVEKWREILNVPKTKSYKEFKIFNRNILQFAIKDINEYAHYTITAKIIKSGLKASKIRFTWKVKSDDERNKIKRDNSFSKLGKKAKKNGTVETVVKPKTHWQQASKETKNEWIDKHGQDQTRAMLEYEKHMKSQ